jgi:uncharacterized integral membrane protein (TIGR00698 family)
MTARLIFLISLAVAAAVSIPVVGLFAGIVVALTTGNPWPQRTKTASTWILQASVVLLGFSMDLFSIARAGRDGAVAAFVGITLTLLVGRAVGRLLRVPETTSWLISIGTAICGGSAIAACAPALRATDDEVAASTGTVFVLNAVALVTFPTLGTWLALSDRDFGMLAALAIHDTSSVVGAASAFSPAALEVATTVKLARALFILPLPVLLVAFVVKSHPQTTTKKPWFVIAFVLAATIATFVPVVGAWGPSLAVVGQHGLSVALFGIGAGLSAKALRAIGPRPLVQGLLLWGLVIVTTVAALRLGWL